MDDLAKLRRKISQLEQVVEDKDLQIQAILETLDDREKELDELQACKSKVVDQSKQIQTLKEAYVKLMAEHAVELAKQRTALE